jgi:hypothetical protein
MILMEGQLEKDKVKSFRGDFSCVKMMFDFIFSGLS